MQPGYRPTAGERWSINLPAMIGVAFVFVVGVVVWVIASSGDDEALPPSESSSTTGIAATATTVAAGTSIGETSSPTTTPSPLPSGPPSTTAPETSSTTTPTTTAPTTVPPTTVVPTTAPGAADGAVAGDLAVPGRPMQRPPCDGAFITILASPIGAQATGESVAAVLDQYPGSNYLRTDQTCRSLRADVDGQPIYVVYLGPFAVDSDACQARAEGPDGAYARQLSNDVGPDHAVTCT